MAKILVKKYFSVQAFLRIIKKTHLIGVDWKFCQSCVIICFLFLVLIESMVIQNSFFLTKIAFLFLSLISKQPQCAYLQDGKSIGCVNFMSYFENEVFMTIRIRSNGCFPTLNAMIYLSQLDARNLWQDLSLLSMLPLQSLSLFVSVCTVIFFFSVLRVGN